MEHIEGAHGQATGLIHGGMSGWRSTLRAASRNYELALPAILLAVALIVRLLVAWSQLDWLVDHPVPDDAFYYFRIARNVVSGAGLTYDGLSATNGFHPLWLAVILPAFAMVNDRVLVLHWVLTESAVLDTIATYLLYRLCRRLQVIRPASIVVAALYALNPASLLSSRGAMNGLETSVAVPSLLLFINAYVSFRDSLASQESRSKTRHLLVYGGASALLFLARTDNALLLSACGVELLWRFRRDLRSSARILLSGFFALVLASPWLVWTYATFGNIVQTSGYSVSYVNRLEAASQGQAVTSVLLNLVDAVLELFVPLGVTAVSKRSPSFLLGATLVVICLGYCALEYRKDGRRPGSAPTEVLARGLSILLPFVIGFAIFFAVQSYRGWRVWYYTSATPVLLLLAGLLTSYVYALDRPRGSRGGIREIATRLIYPLWFLMAVGFFAGYAFAVRNDAVPVSTGTSNLRAARFLDDNLPNGSRVGAWNAGIMGYFFDKGTVYNLDGLVNNQIYPYLVERRLAAYVRAARIEYLADSTDAINHYAKLVWGEPLSAMNPAVLYRDDGSGANAQMEVVRFSYPELHAR